LIALDLDTRQREAVEAPLDECLAILGPPASGKSTALAARGRRAREITDTQPLLVDQQCTLATFAAEILRDAGRDVTLVDDVEAELLFARGCTPLFELQWDEFGRDQLDPEVPGLRTPERFLASAFRLIRRLGDASVDPAQFLATALNGATDFYANPPNFSDPSLLVGTKSVYHDSLNVDMPELKRQHRREIDLAKILAKLYETYVGLVAKSGRMTGRDAVAAATHVLRESAVRTRAVRERHRFAFIDDAQNLTEAELGLLRTIFGEALNGVTLCGDPSSSVALARRTQPQTTFAAARRRIELHDVHRKAQLQVQRLSGAAQEAAFIGDTVVEWIAGGVPPERIAVIFRSVRNVELYENALLDRNVATAISGDINLFADRRALDAIALLWNVYDPFRHDWLLRTLSGALGLSDASVVTLCGDPPDPQRALFTLDEEPPPTARSSRWNAKRDLRLGWNVVRGEVDDALSSDAAQRLTRFRSLRRQWLTLVETVDFAIFARTVWREALPREGEPDSARARTQQLILRRLLGRLTAYAAERPQARLGDVLAYAQQRLESDLESCEDLDGGAGFVQVANVESTQGVQFERIVIGNVRPGAFPLWYAPDAFLFSPSLGMIPKENAGDARASRTAKFSYYMFKNKAAAHYNDRERRAFKYAMARATQTALVTSWGTPTRGITAPELLEELR
jgi:superfamily I DNA/RNA helicase